MARWLISFLFLLALVGGVLAGTPLHSSSTRMMKCCDKAKSKDKSPAANAADLCCAVNCSESVPTQSSSSFNFSPSNITISKSIAEQIEVLFPKVNIRLLTLPQYSREILSRTFQPKYIQHNSFLI
ncbi:MAG: hypothetical protein WBD27_04990 [Pyrinomonadaceae bacterium]